MAGVWQKTIVAEDVQFGADSGNVTVDIPRSNFIGSIMLRVENTNGSTSNIDVAQTIEKGITKIEVLASGYGPKTLKSYRGTECRRRAQYEFGDLPPANETQAASGVQFAVFPIMFGRHLHDTRNIYPAFKPSTLQMKITWAFTDSTTAGFTTSETNAKYTIVVNEYVSGDSSMGKNYFVDTEVETFTSLASGNRDVKLPLGQKIRSILVRAYEAAVEDGTDITEYELRLNNAVTGYKNIWDEQQFEEALRYKLKTSKKFVAFMQNNDTIDTEVSRIQGRGGQVALVDQHSGLFDVVAGDRLTLSLFDLATPSAISSDENVQVAVEGIGASFCINVDFDYSGDGNEYFSTSGAKELTLRLKQSAAGADVRVVVQEVYEAV